MKALAFGLDTFGDVALDDNGDPISHAASIRQVVDEAILAEDVGIDVFAAGEHHRAEYAISSPDTVLAGIATRTSRIRLSSSVTVLSSDDPVRVFQRFATVDALSRGRAEAMLGRGSFTESYPLFGFEPGQKDVLFEEKLELFVRLLDENPVTWSCTTRAALTDADVFPKTESGRLVTWIAAGATPQSVVRAARYGLPLMLSIIAGPIAGRAPQFALYRRATAELGNPGPPLGLHSPGFVADTDEQAKEIFYPGYKIMRDRIGAERGIYPPLTSAQFEEEISGGSLYVGSPETVARRLAATIGTLGVDRFDLIYATGAQPASARLRSIELFGSKVVPMIRDLLA